MREPMEPERLEQFLRGYRLPETPVHLDQRVLEEGIAIVTDTHEWSVAGIARTVLHRLGFGHVTWLIDFITTTDAEYRVEFA